MAIQTMTQDAEAMYERTVWDGRPVWEALQMRRGEWVRKEPHPVGAESVEGIAAAEHPEGSRLHLVVKKKWSIKPPKKGKTA